MSLALFADVAAGDLALGGGLATVGAAIIPAVKMWLDWRERDAERRAKEAAAIREEDTRRQALLNNAISQSVAAIVEGNLRIKALHEKTDEMDSKLDEVRNTLLKLYQPHVSA